MRYATTEEAAAATVIAQEAVLTGPQKEDKKAYVDVSNETRPPKIRIRSKFLKVKRAHARAQLERKTLADKMERPQLR
jgi:hypothetical protein